ncbi:2855_t:CDS:2 [Entrophospora sp. SA101]|nr:2855_t:CDS:2 [Entrophospora sp. SA101]
MLDGKVEKLKDNYLLVATSRPETIFADVALFVNPQDKRYQKYIGQEVQHPITQKIIPVLADEKIIIDFGTGVLKCTPGHDFFDYELGKKYNLPLISCYNEKGILNNLAVSQRSGATIEPLLSTQWFCDLPQLIQKIETKNPDFLSKINFCPVRFQQIIQD